MDVKDFDYDLPEELIAQDPLEDRSSSRLMVLDKKTGEVSHHVFKEIVKYLCTIQQDMQRSRRQPFFTTNYMRYFHQMVINNVCQMVSRQFVG